MNEITMIRNALLMNLNQVSYTISFNANGASGTMSNVIITSSSYLLPGSSYSREHYNYNGWKINNAGTLYAPGQSIPVTANIVLYAQWTAILYTVSYYVDGYYWTSGSCSYGGSVTLQSATKSQFTFIGWATSNGGAAIYAGGSSYGFGANINLYAVFGGTVTFMRINDSAWKPCIIDAAGHTSIIVPPNTTVTLPYFYYQGTAYSRPWYDSMSCFQGELVGWSNANIPNVTWSDTTLYTST